MPVRLPPSPGAIYGRKTELELIGRLLDQSATALSIHALLLVGDGGTGKTRLLEAVAERLERERRPFLPIYDFYHIDNFKASSIESAIMGRLVMYDSRANEDFTNYMRARSDLDRRRESGEDFEKAQRALRTRFVECYNAFVASQPHSVVLLFDTVEQAINLSDHAEQVLTNVKREASRGGEFWLQDILPQLTNTLVVLSGRHRSLYDQPVALYGAIAAAMPSERLEISGVLYDASRDLARHIQCLLTEPTQLDSIREHAKAVDLNDRKLHVWALVSDGLPFWTAMLFTCDMLGVVPPQIDVIEEQLFAQQQAASQPEQPPPATQRTSLTIEERQQLRDIVMLHFLHDLDAAQDALVLVLQWMATIRKGLSLEILRAIAAAENQAIDIETTFDCLAALLIVKRRRLPRYTNPGPEPEETMLFLHDEMYLWLDQNHAGANVLRASVSNALIGWYDEMIESTDHERLTAVDQQLALPSGDSGVPALRATIEATRKRKQQLVLDQMSYYFQHDLDLGVRMYNMYAYTALLRREFGFGVALRQEGLRSLYRRDGISFLIEVECAARWVLRALHTDDYLTARARREQLSRYYAHERQHPGLPFAFLRLADAQTRLLTGMDHAGVHDLLDDAQRIAQRYQQEYKQQHAGAEDGWCTYLLAQINNYHGYYHRLDYDMYNAILAYRRAISFEIRQPSLFLPGAIMTNLAFAHSEQGELEDARELGAYGLMLNQRFGSEFITGLSFNALARIEIRAGMPHKALQYTERASEIFANIDSPRGRRLNLTVLAEAHRKSAELLDYDAGEQDVLFERAISLFQEAEQLLEEHKFTTVDRWCEVYRGLGCAHRSWAQALARRRVGSARAAEHFHQAKQWLDRALNVSIGHQPRLIQMDIREDIAVVFVNQNVFDQRVYHYLETAEALAPQEYKIRENIGLSDIARPTRSYWRELGQCQLQRMLCGFGKYSQGFYNYAEDGTRSLVSIGDDQFLREAAEHLVLMLAYLLKYARAAWVIERAEQLARHELRRDWTEAHFKLMSQAAYQAARRYNLLNTEAFARAEDLLRKAHRDLDLPFSQWMAEMGSPI